MNNDSYARKNGHPPSASKTIAIDFDGTIVPWGGLMAPKKPMNENVAPAIRDLRARGYRIVIFTSRASRTWWRDEGKVRGVNPWEFGREQIAYVKTILGRADIPYDLITAEKLPALAYFDDKAVEIKRYWPLDLAIKAWLEAQ